MKQSLKVIIAVAILVAATAVITYVTRSDATSSGNKPRKATCAPNTKCWAEQQALVRVFRVKRPPFAINPTTKLVRNGTSATCIVSQKNPIYICRIAYRRYATHISVKMK